jgi:hypothetical protein
VRFMFADRSAIGYANVFVEIHNAVFGVNLILRHKLTQVCLCCRY